MDNRNACAVTRPSWSNNTIVVDIVVATTVAAVFESVTWSTKISG